MAPHAIASSSFIVHQDRSWCAPFFQSDTALSAPKNEWNKQPTKKEKKKNKKKTGSEAAKVVGISGPSAPGSRETVRSWGRLNIHRQSISARRRSCLLWYHLAFRISVALSCAAANLLSRCSADRPSRHATARLAVQSIVNTWHWIATIYLSIHLCACVFQTGQ